MLLKIKEVLGDDQCIKHFEDKNTSVWTIKVGNQSLNTGDRGMELFLQALQEKGGQNAC